MKRPPYTLKVGDKVRVEKARGVCTIYGTGTVDSIYKNVARVLYTGLYGPMYRRFDMNTGISMGGDNVALPLMRIVPIEAP